MSNQNNEYIIYIHGVSQENNLPHTETYNQLHQGIQAVSSKDFPHRQTWQEANRCDVEWGWDHSSIENNSNGDRFLADAQDQFGDDILQTVKDTSDFTIRPARLLNPELRDLMIKGFSDMFYYCSYDGKNSVRATVASQIIKSIKQPLANNEPISLTLMGHSAGSIVAFDLLFYLFAPDDVLNKHEFIEKKNNTEIIEDFKHLRTLAQAQKLRIRRLITFGSPISMLAFRSNAVVKILAEGEKLNPDDYGLNQNPEIFGEALAQPRWLNFWDKDDIISWPVQPLMQNSPTIKDIYPYVSNNIAKAHNEYWDNEKVHQQIAQYW